MAQAILIHQTGGPEQLNFETVPDIAPAAGQVRVAHRAVGVNYIDTYHRTGLYPLPSYPSGIGLEAAGVIAALGEGVSGWAVGNRAAYAGAVKINISRNFPLCEARKAHEHLESRQSTGSLLLMP